MSILRHNQDTQSEEDVYFNFINTKIRGHKKNLWKGYQINHEILWSDKINRTISDNRTSKTNYKIVDDF